MRISTVVPLYIWICFVTNKCVYNIENFVEVPKHMFALKMSKVKAEKLYHLLYHYHKPKSKGSVRIWVRRVPLARLKNCPTQTWVVLEQDDKNPGLACVARKKAQKL